MNVLDRTKQLLGRISKTQQRNLMKEEKTMDEMEPIINQEAAPLGADGDGEYQQEAVTEVQANDEFKELEAQESAFRAEKEAFEKEKAEWEIKLAEAKAILFKADVEAVASKQGVDAAELNKWIAKFGFTEISKVESFAEMLPKLPVFSNFDSGTGISGVDISLLTPEEKYMRGLEEERKRMGRR